MNPYPQFPPDNEDDAEVWKYFFLFLRNWHWFVVAMFLSLTTAWFVNRYSTRIYSVTASLLIEDDKGRPNILGSSGIGGPDVMSGFGLFPSMKNLQNQLLILQSESQVKMTIMELDFEVSYFREKMVGTREVYHEVPFVIIPDKSRAQPLETTFRLTFTGDSTFIINTSHKGNGIKWYSYLTESQLPQPAPLREEIRGRFGVMIDGYAFTVMPRNWVIQTGNGETQPWFFNFNSYDRLISRWGKMLKLEPMHRDASMVSLTIETASPAKAVIFLNKHLEMYLQRTLDKKNQFANNTIEFINAQLGSITDSLSITEAALEEYRQRHRVVDLSFQAQHLFSQVSELSNRKAELQLQQDYFRYLSDYFSKTSEPTDIVAPSVMGIDDPLLNTLVLEINRLAGEKIAMGGESSRNPYISNLNAQIRNVRNTLEENASSMINNNNQAMADIDSRLELLMAEVQRLPQTERELFGIERIFKLNDHIYTYLLQRRYEAQIAKASNAPDNEIIDYAGTVGGPIKPRTIRNYAFALMLGLIIPWLSLVFINRFNNKVTGGDDIQTLTGLPIAGHITHSIKDQQSVVLNDPQSLIAEDFRSLLTRMQYFTKTTHSPVVLITSSMAAEGKSFSSLNLAAAYSLSGKRTVLVEFDMRKPGIYQEFGLKNDRGVSTYLSGKDGIDDIKQNSGYDKLSVIAAGPIPPNPFELAASERTALLFKELKERYDYIVVDSAAIGLVSDTSALAAIADMTIVVVRHNATIKPMLAKTLSDARQNGLTNISLLINDISRSNGIYGYGGGYGYAYG
jgi:tyrosine-protein kinase Etk/Wzc